MEKEATNDTAKKTTPGAIPNLRDHGTRREWQRVSENKGCIYFQRMRIIAVGKARHEIGFRGENSNNCTKADVRDHMNKGFISCSLKYVRLSYVSLSRTMKSAYLLHNDCAVVCL